MITFKHVWSSFFCGLLFAGCSPSISTGRIDLEIKNESSQSLTEAVVWFGEKKFRAGDLRPTIFADYMYYPTPVTKLGQVEWVDGIGQKHSRVLDLGGLYRPGQSGLLQIAITETSVEVRMLPLPVAKFK